MKQSQCTHIIQKAIGNVLIGNAGLSKQDISSGFVVMLCTVDKNNRFVDVTITRKQMSDLIESLTNEIKTLDSKESD